MKTRWTIALLILSAVHILVAKDRIDVLKKSIPLEKELALEVKISFAAGTLYLHEGKANTLFRGELNFTDLEPEIVYSVNEQKGILEITTPGFGDKDEEEKNYNFKDLNDLKQNSWHLYFSPEIPIRLSIENGAAKNVLDFGKLKIQEFDLSTGASETLMNFSEPNPIVMDRLNIQSGVSEIKGRNMLNANFKKFRFEGGVGDYDFYLDGKLKQSPRMDIEIGVATARLIVNPDTPFKVRVNSSFLSSVRIGGADEVDDDYWVSDNYRKNAPYLNISADVGMGGFKLKVRD